MKLIPVAVLVAVTVLYVNAIFDECACQPGAQIPALQCATCFNSKQALYQKYPLLYKIKSWFCCRHCDGLKTVNPCPATPISPLVLAPAPPVTQPCLPAAPPAANPQLISALLALSAAEPSQPGFSPCTCV